MWLLTFFFQTFSGIVSLNKLANLKAPYYVKNFKINAKEKEIQIRVLFQENNGLREKCEKTKRKEKP